MARRNPKVLVGVFHTADAARAAVDDLVKAGFKQEDIGVISHDTQGKKKTAKKKGGTKWEEGAVTGAATGAGVGALWALGIAAGVLNPIGPIVAGGLLASVLASAAGGAAGAGLVGALIGLGISEGDAPDYESEFKEGRTLVTIRANGNYAEALEIIRRHGGYDRSTAVTNVEAAATTTKIEKTNLTAPVATTNESEEATVEVKREQVKPRKRTVKKGDVRVRKEVVTDTQTISVPVEREEVVIERRPVRKGTRKTAVGPTEEIRIPVKEEVVDVEKEVVVDEEVKVGKRKVRDTKTVTTPVRREKVKVEEQGDTQVTRRTRT